MRRAAELVGALALLGWAVAGTALDAYREWAKPCPTCGR